MLCEDGICISIMELETVGSIEVSSNAKGQADQRINGVKRVLRRYLRARDTDKRRRTTRQLEWRTG